MTVTFMKLRSGRWGLRVSGDREAAKFEVGKPVTVTKRSGDLTTCVVGSVLWSNDELAFCTINRKPPVFKPVEVVQDEEAA